MPARPGPARPRARLARARRHRRGGVRQAGRGRRAAGLRRGDRLPPGRGAAGALTRRTPASRAAPRIAGELPLAPTKEFAAPILGTVGEVTAEMIEEHPDVVPARRRGRAVRPPGAVRRAAARHARRRSSTRSARTARSRELFRVEPVDGKPLQLTLDARLQHRRRAALAGVGPASALVAIRPSTGDDPGRGERARDRRLQHGDVRAVRARLDVQDASSSLALLRAGLTPDTVGAVHRRRSIVDGKRVQELRRLPGRRPRPASRCAPRSPTPATPPSSPSAASSADDDLVDAAASLGMGVDHDLGFPAYFGNVVPPAVGDREGRRPDRPGQDPRLADGDGHRDRVGPVRARRWCRGWSRRSTSTAAGRRAADRRPRPRRCARCCAASSPSGSGGAARRRTRPAGDRQDRHRGVRARTASCLTHAWMIAAQGDLAVAVFVDEGQSGSGTAGPILEQFLRAARS